VAIVATGSPAGAEPMRLLNQHLLMAGSQKLHGVCTVCFRSACMFVEREAYVVFFIFVRLPPAMGKMPWYQKIV